MTTTKTFYERAFLNFTHQTKNSYQKGLSWYGNVRQLIHGVNEKLMKWISRHRRQIILSVGIFVFIGLTALLIYDCFRGVVINCAQTGVGGLLGGSLLGVIIGGLIAIALYYSLWLIDRLLLGIIYILLLTPFLAGALFYGVYLLGIVILQFVLLIPLTIFFILNGLWLFWQRIFYTCPNAHCSFRQEGIYRGIPTYVCPKCGESHQWLWPNLYGLLFHLCVCGHQLPTLDILGRNKLMRLCAVCKTELPPRKLPEELVALVGASNVGKTTFLLASIQHLSQNPGKHNVRVELPIPSQRAEITQGIDNMKHGVPPLKTDATVQNAYQFLIERQGRKSWLYYYDAMGEAFTTIERYGRMENIRHLNGILLLIDPFSLDGLRGEAGKVNTGLAASTTRIDDVIAAMIGSLGTVRRERGRTSIPLAVVITKADTDQVQAELGDIRQTFASTEKCEASLKRWGAGNALNLIQQNFKTIRFFACSSLGRSPQPGDSRPFQAFNVLEPLLWILNIQ